MNSYGPEHICSKFQIFWISSLASRFFYFRDIRFFTSEKTTVGTLSFAMIWDFVIAISSARTYSWRLICLSDSPILVLPDQLSMMKMVKLCYPIPFVRVSTYFSPDDVIIWENIQITYRQGRTIENLESRFWTLLSNVQVHIGDTELYSDQSP